MNMFDEYSMTNPKLLAEYVGFTEYEVKALCSEFGMDFGKTRKWYDGYSFPRVQHIYNPKSVVDAMLNGEFDSYWTQTETYEALKIYLDMNFDGLKDDIIYMLGGGHCEINTRTFQNDMTTFSSKDDVFTLLVHLGYLAYDTEKREVFIPNMEIEEEFQRSIQGSNNENDLSCVISIAYYAAKSYYSVVREFPSGKGFADMIFCPHKDCMDKPALIVELKWDRDANGAITQIKERKYMQALDDYQGEVLLVGISYDTKHKIHECVIEQITKQLNRLIPVLKVVDLGDVESIERELILCKVVAKDEDRSEILRIAEIFGAEIIDVTPRTYTLQAVGDERQIRSLIELLRPIGIRELVRSGKVGITRANQFSNTKSAE